MSEQTEIPGTERQKNKRVTKAATAYREVRNKRMELTREEKAAKLKLIEVMREEHLETYVDEDEDLSVFYTAKEQVRVRSADSEQPDEDE